MRWLKRWCPDETDTETSRHALEDAQDERKRVEDRTSYVESLAEKLASHSEKNHFSELIFQAMRRKQP